MDFLAVFSPEQVEAWFEWGGYFVLFGLLFACGLGLPLPEDIPLLLGRVLRRAGEDESRSIACVLAWLRDHRRRLRALLASAASTG